MKVRKGGCERCPRRILPAAAAAPRTLGTARVHRKPTPPASGCTAACRAARSSRPRRVWYACEMTTASSADPLAASRRAAGVGGRWDGRWAGGGREAGVGVAPTLPSPPPPPRTRVDAVPVARRLKLGGRLQGTHALSNGCSVVAQHEAAGARLLAHAGEEAQISQEGAVGQVAVRQAQGRRRRRRGRRSGAEGARQAGDACRGEGACGGHGARVRVQDLRAKCARTRRRNAAPRASPLPSSAASRRSSSGRCRRLCGLRRRPAPSRVQRGGEVERRAVLLSAAATAAATATASLWV